MEKYIFECEHLLFCIECPFCTETENCLLKESTGNPESCVKMVKPKELVWSEPDVYGAIVAKMGMLSFKLIPEKYAVYASISSTIGDVSYTTDINLSDYDRVSMEDGKTFCQEYYNKLFYEMMP